MTESERWQTIEAALPMLRSICKGTLQRANCVTMSTEELLSELLPQCFDWLAGFDASINPDPLALLSVSARFKARTIVQQAITRNGNRIPIEDLTTDQQPCYFVDMLEQMTREAVLLEISKLPPRLAYIAQHMCNGSTLQEVATELGLTRNAVFYEWQKAISILAPLLTDCQS